MSISQYVRFVFRRGTTAQIAAELASSAITKYEGEPRWNTDKKILYVHDGTTNVRVNNRLEVAVKTGDYTAATTDQVIVCNKATAMTITLPTAAATGQRYYIKNIGAGAVTVSKAGDTIDGETSQTVSQWECLEVVDYSANCWAIL